MRIEREGEVWHVLYVRVGGVSHPCQAVLPPVLPSSAVPGRAMLMEPKPLYTLSCRGRRGAGTGRLGPAAPLRPAAERAATRGRGAGVGASVIEGGSLGIRYTTPCCRSCSMRAAPPLLGEAMAFVSAVVTSVWPSAVLVPALAVLAVPSSVPTGIALPAAGSDVVGGVPSSTKYMPAPLLRVVSVSCPWLSAAALSAVEV